MAEVELKKTAGVWTIMALAIGSIAGSAMFFGAAIGSKYSGNLVIIAWIVLSIFAIYISACFGELVALFPKSGGVYEFSKQAYGRLTSFVVGWLAWIVGNITTMVLIVAAMEYLLPEADIAIKLAASLILIIVLNIIAYVGLEASGITLVVFAILTIAVIVAVISKGVFHINPANFTPFFTHELKAVFVALFFIAEGYFGWEAVAYLAEETKNAEKVIPKVLLISTGVIAILGLLLYVVMLGVIPWEQLAETDASVSVVSNILFGEIGSSIIGIGIFLTLLGSAAGGIISLPRLVMALARDKLFLGQFKEVHSKYKTPHKAVIFQAVILIIILALGFGSYQVLLSLLVPLALIMYLLVILAVPVLRIRKPELARPFKVPLGMIGPIIASLFFIGIIGAWLMTEADAFNLLTLSASLVFFGVPLYFLVEIYYDPKMITKVNDMFAFAGIIGEKITFPRSLRREIMVFMGDIRGSTVLEFGCGVGTLTKYLVKAVGQKGKVYATHFSRNSLKITKRRVEHRMWKNKDRNYGKFEVIHDQEHMIRVHPDVKYANVVVSVGMLGYLQDIRKVLKEMAAIMPEGGKICFVEYSELFHLIPNVEWLSSNKAIENIFRECGFSVRVVRKKSFLWNKIFIYGVRGEGMAYI